MSASETKKRAFPHPLWVTILVVLAALILTWIIPSGEFVREVNESGLSVVVPDQFSFLTKTYLRLWNIPTYIVKGFLAVASILPTASALMGNLAVANVPYTTWMKYMWKVFTMWVITGSVMLIIAQMIHYGPM